MGRNQTVSDPFQQTIGREDSILSPVIAGSDYEEAARSVSPCCFGVQQMPQMTSHATGLRVKGIG